MKNNYSSIVFVLLAALCLAETAEAACSFSLIVSLVALKPVDMGQPGFSMGDVTNMDADLKYKGKTVGSAIFNTVTNRMPDPTAVDEHRRLEQRLGIAQYHFGNNNDSLVTIGEFIYTEPSSPQPYSISQVRAVTGGTGKFKYARGQVTLTRIDATTFKHDFELDANPKLCNF